MKQYLVQELTTKAFKLYPTVKELKIGSEFSVGQGFYKVIQDLTALEVLTGGNKITVD